MIYLTRHAHHSNDKAIHVAGLSGCIKRQIPVDERHRMDAGALRQAIKAVRLAKVEVDEGENMKLAGHYMVRGFPTVIIFVDGEEVARFSSAKPTHWIEEWIQEHVGDRLFA